MKFLVNQYTMTGCGIFQAINGGAKTIRSSHANG